jgi:hypothetical protein
LRERLAEGDETGSRASMRRPQDQLQQILNQTLSLRSRNARELTGWDCRSDRLFANDGPFPQPPVFSTDRSLFPAVSRPRLLCRHHAGRRLGPDVVKANLRLRAATSFATLKPPLVSSNLSAHNLLAVASLNRAVTDRRQLRHATAPLPRRQPSNPPGPVTIIRTSSAWRSVSALESTFFRCFLVVS